MSKIIDQGEALALINAEAQAKKQAEMRAFDTHAPLPIPAPERHRLTHAEAVDRAQLLALFDQSDARGQLLLLQIAAIHADRYPKA